MIWFRGVVGVIAVLLGLVWIGQGLGALRGSMMSGHPGYALLGVVVALVGVWLLWATVRLRARARL